MTRSAKRTSRVTRTARAAKVLKATPPARGPAVYKRVEPSATREDAVALTKTQLARMVRITPMKRLRIELGLSQAEFAYRFNIPVGTIRDWEQRRSEPDQAAQAYLKVIAADAAFVERVLPRPPGYRSKNRINMNDPRLKALKERFGVSDRQLADAVRDVGASAAKVEEYLAKKK